MRALCCFQTWNKNVYIFSVHHVASWQGSVSDKLTGQRHVFRCNIAFVMAAEISERILKSLQVEGLLDTLLLAKSWNEDHQKIVGAVNSLLSLGDVSGCTFWWTSTVFSPFLHIWSSFRVRTELVLFPVLKNFDLCVTFTSNLTRIGQHFFREHILGKHTYNNVFLNFNLPCLILFAIKKLMNYKWSTGFEARLTGSRQCSHNPKSCLSFNGNKQNLCFKFVFDVCLWYAARQVKLKLCS